MDDMMLQVEGRLARAHMKGINECPYEGDEGERWRQGWRDEPAPSLVCRENRLGDVVVSDYRGEVRKFSREGKPDKYFAWYESTCRTFGDLDDAAKWVGITKKRGCSDYAGEVRLGRRVDGNAYGEIWKHLTGVTTVYYLWEAGMCVGEYFTLGEARKAIGIGAAKSMTPKLQNRKGRS